MLADEEQAGALHRRTDVPATVAPPPGHRRFEHVDGLRAVAFGMVLLFHASQAAGAQTPTVWGRILAHLNLGVPLFFMISAFLLFRPFVDAQVNGKPDISVARFVYKRALRIVPAFWVALLVVGLVPAFAAADPAYGDIISRHAPLHFGFAQIYYEPTVHSGFVHAWSLCVEVSFYLVLAVGIVASRGRRSYGGLALLFLGGASAASLLLHELTDHLSRPRGYIWLDVTLPTTFAWFGAGLALALVSVRAAAPTALQRAAEALGRRAGLCWSLAAAAYVAMSEGPIGTYLGMLIVGVLLLLPATLATDAGGLVRRVLRLRLVAWLGAVSYGLYLWHLPLLALLAAADLPGWWSSFAGLVLLTAAATVPVAAASYYLIERPVLRLKDAGSSRVAGRPRRARP